MHLENSQKKTNVFINDSKPLSFAVSASAEVNNKDVLKAEAPSKTPSIIHGRTVQKVVETITVRSCEIDKK